MKNAFVYFTFTLIYIFMKTFKFYHWKSLQQIILKVLTDKNYMNIFIITM